MYTRKSKGLTTVPCGTPDATGFVDDEFPSNTTVWIRSDNNLESMRECCLVLHNDQVSLIVGYGGPYQRP
jgi:hypothetical protein